MFIQTYKGISSISGLQKKIVFPPQHPYSWKDDADSAKGHISSLGYLWLQQSSKQGKSFNKRAT